MKAGTGYKILGAGSLVLLITMFIVPFMTDPAYSIISDTIGDLGSYDNPEAWIINSAIIVAALSSVVAGWGYYEGFVFHRLILVLFSISLSLTAIFNQSPAYQLFPDDLNENIWHLYFTCTSSLSFIILTSSTAFIREREGERLLAVITAFSILILSIVMHKSENIDGILNRLILLIVFGWMIYNFRKID
jgi:hypothetical membrane protein